MFFILKVAFLPFNRYGLAIHWQQRQDAIFYCVSHLASFDLPWTGPDLA